MKSARFHTEARQELADAVDYYEGQRPGLGLRFEAAVEAAVGRIQRHPQLFGRFLNSPYRKCLVKRFPYTVYFEERPRFIRIMAVAHQKRQEGYWLGRT